MNSHTGLLGENVNTRKLSIFAEKSELEILNRTIAEGVITWQSREFQSATDYIIVNSNVRSRITNMTIDEEGAFDMRQTIIF